MEVLALFLTFLPTLPAFMLRLSTFSRWLPLACSLVLPVLAVGLSPGISWAAEASSVGPKAEVPGVAESASSDEAEKPDADTATDASSSSEIAAGHSYHGETFDDGPRQRAYLMSGTGKVNFPITTSSDEARAFINQSVGQLHGFWYFEAERSFRQAAMLDPDCAIAYWGMAMANINNEKRAKGFIAEAVKRKHNASDHERMYIDALDAYWKADPKKKPERATAFLGALENILHKHPDDLDAKAWVVMTQWQASREGLKIDSYLASDALLSEIFAREPLHPAHHYRIHWWDDKKASKAVQSAALCGQSAPGIAHMWHMPGHIYSKLKRYHDAAWQQEASARVDHAYMIRDRVMPDQIHNFAHNNEWLIRNLIHIGAWREGLALAKNMVSLPRHPRWNTPEKFGSFRYGRQRLMEVLEKFELWDETIALADTPFLQAGDDVAEQTKRLRALGRAYARIGDAEQTAQQIAALEKLLTQEKANRKKAEQEAEDKARAESEKEQQKDIEKEKNDNALTKRIDAAKKKAARSFRGKITALERAIDELHGHLQIAEGKSEDGVKLLAKSKCDLLMLGRWQAAVGRTDEAEKLVRKEVKSHKNEVLPLAALVEVLWKSGKRDDAYQAFEQLRGSSSAIDLDCPVFARLAPIAKEFGFVEDWRLPRETPADFGTRPSLDSLGPKHWRPYVAPSWALADAAGEEHCLKQYEGKPVIVAL